MTQSQDIGNKVVAEFNVTRLIIYVNKFLIRIIISMAQFVKQYSYESHQLIDRIFVSNLQS